MALPARHCAWTHARLDATLRFGGTFSKGRAMTTLETSTGLKAVGPQDTARRWGTLTDHASTIGADAEEEDADTRYRHRAA